MAGHTNGFIAFKLVHGVPFLSVEVSANNRTVLLDNVLIDSGSATCLFSADKMLDVGLVCAGTDDLYIVSGVGGGEYVLSKTVDSIRVGCFSVDNFKIEIGAMDYGFGFDGIIGMNFLLATKAKLDCERSVLIE